MTNILVNPGTTTAVATIDIGGGVESPRINLISATGNTLYGAPGSPPAGVTVLTVQGVSTGTPQLVSQSGVWTVQPGNTPNTSPWLVTLASGTTAAIGAVTQSGTWTVQPGNTPNTSPWLVAPASGVPFPINVTQIGTTAVGSTVGLPTLLRDGAGAARFAAVNASNQLSVSVDGGSLTAASNINITQVGSATVAVGSGAMTTGTMRVALATDSPGAVALGQVIMASSVPVAIASDQSAVPISINSGTAIVQYALPANSISGAPAALTNTAITTLIAAPGAGLRNFLTQLLVTNAHATVSTVVVIGDGSVGTTMTQGYAVAAGGGFSVSFPQPLRQSTSNTALSCFCVTTGSSVYISASGFKGV